jgi:predicted DNA-binding protein with PD1-like motif
MHWLKRNRSKLVFKLQNDHMKQAVLKGDLWSARQAGNVYVLSINNGAGIVNAIMDFVVKNDIKCGNIAGLGAVSDATLRFFDPKTKKYVDKAFSEQMEIANLTGNISSMNDKPYLHMHITLGNSNYTAYAGHLLQGHIHGAGELYITTFNAVIGRKFSEETGINLYDL